jgi:filamentous hemagglutinin family protein
MVSQISRLAFVGLVGLTIATQSTIAQAQVTADGTLPTGITSPNGLDFTIDGGARSGGNLFHSFSQFSVPTSGSAVFNNATDVQNIFSRVTGGTASNIDGAIRANGTANLFLLNPSGILFGANASLNIGGSFVGTTASSIQFADGGEFSAVNPTPLLTMSVPIGLQFGNVPGHIMAQGAVLETQPNSGLALIGGEVLLNNTTVRTFGGTIDVGSISGAESVALSAYPTGWQVNYPNVRSFGDIRLAARSFLISRGQAGGKIHLQGKNVEIVEYSEIISETRGAVNGEPLTITASESVRVSDISENGNLYSAIGINNYAGSTGKGGSIQITAPYVEVAGGLVTASAYGDGDAGDIQVNAQRIWLDRSGQFISSAYEGAGNGGNLVIKASDSINLIGSFPAILSDGSSFNYLTGLVSGVQPGSAGNGGSVLVETGQLNLLNGGFVTTSALGGSQGNGGNLLIRAKNIRVDGLMIDGFNTLSGIQTEMAVGSQGNAGSLQLFADRLQVLNGGQISASNLGIGKAGNLEIKASSVEVTGFDPTLDIPSRIAAEAQGIADSGSIEITTQKLDILDRAVVTASNTGTGKAGNLNIRAKTIRLDKNAQLTAEINAGSGGNIDITGDLLLMRNASQITSTASNSANGGNIKLDVATILGLENSDIIANAQKGQGGNIQITTQGIVGLKFRNTLTPRQDLTNDITASSEFSVNGSVQINNIGVDPNSALTALPVDIVDPSQQIAKGCDSSQGSSFAITGRGGTPDNPTQHLMLDRTWSDVRPIASIAPARSPKVATTSAPTALVEATTWQRNPQGQPELLAGPLIEPKSLTASCAPSHPAIISG